MTKKVKKREADLKGWEATVKGMEPCTKPVVKSIIEQFILDEQHMTAHNLVRIMSMAALLSLAVSVKKIAEGMKHDAQ